MEVSFRAVSRDRLAADRIGGTCGLLERLQASDGCQGSSHLHFDRIVRHIDRYSKSRFVYVGEPALGVFRRIHAERPYHAQTSRDGRFLDFPRWSLALFLCPATILWATRDVLVVGLLLAAALFAVALSRRSRFGRSVVAIADDSLAAQACGVPTERILALTFGAGGALAFFAGLFYVLRATSLDPTSGFLPGVLAFSACVIGGIGSLKGSILGAFLAGFLLAVVPVVPLHVWLNAILPDTWIDFMPSLKLSDWSYGVIYGLLIIVVLVRKEGLFGR